MGGLLELCASPWSQGRDCSGKVEERSRECSCPEEPRGGRRLRTAFSAEQISTLESSFQRHRYLGAAERRKLAGRMRLSEVQVSAVRGAGIDDRVGGG